MTLTDLRNSYQIFWAYWNMLMLSHKMNRLGLWVTGMKTRKRNAIFIILLSWVHLLSVQLVAQSCPILCDPMNRSTPGLPVHHQLLKPTQTHVHWVGDAIQPSRPQNWKRSVFIPIPKKGNAKEYLNYHTIVLISHASKVMLKILQARPQQYVNCELPDVQVGFRKGRGTRDQIANIWWIIKKTRELSWVHTIKTAYHCWPWLPGWGSIYQFSPF